MIANKNTMKIITPMQAMSLMRLAGKANTSNIMNHASKFAAFGIEVVEDTPLEAGMQFDGDNVVDIAGVFFRKTIAISEDELHDRAMAELDKAVEEHFLVKLKERNYKSAESAIKYIGGENLAWHNDGTIVKSWVIKCWEHCYGVIDDVHAGIRPIPTKAELIAELPILVWPA